MATRAFGAIRSDVLRQAMLSRVFISELFLLEVWQAMIVQQ
jgi:hypothetical protein